MSREKETVHLTIEDEEGNEKEVDVIVKELTVKQVKRFLLSATNPKAPEEKVEGEEAETKKENFLIGNNILDIFGDEFHQIYDISVKGISWEETEDLTPSQMKELYQAFYKVNKVFFETAQELGIINAIKEVLGSLKEDLLKEFVSLSETVTEML